MTKKIAIIGLGYVGLPLAIEFAKRYETLGFDINPQRIKELKSHYDKTNSISKQEFKEAQHLTFCQNINALKIAQIYIITVPTPLDSNKNPDISILLQASQMIAPLLDKGDIIIYESTTYPTCTRLDCVPILEQYSSLKYNIDFFVGYSPERINPGDHTRKLPQIKKITSGSTPQIAQEIDELYQSIITAGTYLAPSIEVAECAKVLENSQRDLNIALVNELALICDRLNIPTHQVLEAAQTKWNFLPFTPGLVGGHCISVDPYYLTHKAQALGYHSKVIASARYINDAMPHFIASKLIKLLTQQDIKILGSKVLILGITFKENCNDIRNSKVFDVITELVSYGCEVFVLDPLAESQEVYLIQQNFHFYSHHSQLTGQFDALLGAVAHSQFQGIEFSEFLHSKSMIFDLKGMLKFSHARL
ncbi:Vi polysaccharide biosynthesis protein VipA/TviB [Helicobacter enhydrae]|uniref:Vi polysaccharide biosynthesis protein VipA/TviB n=1 Tax=Helicobacter enhydrae TaxID=222136 RepID=A0A1B1U7D9_9HELI|nr:nucleotide sugar dehydrogenase [Helicobacter enhydrae]ANV98703.1 Vi polysaccharide biosynthesis protein VipA/TviB [Helicobacter enhydrae]